MLSRTVAIASLLVTLCCILPTQAAAGRATALDRPPPPARVQVAFASFRAELARQIGTTFADRGHTYDSSELQLFSWLVGQKLHESHDSCLVLYAGYPTKGGVALVDVHRPESLLAITGDLFTKNEMFGGGAIIRAGDLLGEGYFEIALSYFTGFQVEVLRILRNDPKRGLISLPNELANGRTRDCFGSWFGSVMYDEDGDGTPEVVESAYGKSKGDRFKIVFKWNGEKFVEVERRR